MANLVPFDDGVFDSPAIRRCMKGYVRRLDLKRFDSGGDFQLACQATSLISKAVLDKGYGGGEFVRYAVLAAVDICAVLPPYPTVRQVCDHMDGVMLLDGSLDRMALMGWVACVIAVGGTEFDVRCMLNLCGVETRVASRMAFCMAGIDERRFSAEDWMSMECDSPSCKTAVFGL